MGKACWNPTVCLCRMLLSKLTMLSLSVEFSLKKQTASSVIELSSLSFITAAFLPLDFADKVWKFGQVIGCASSFSWVCIFVFCIQCRDINKAYRFTVLYVLQGFRGLLCTSMPNCAVSWDIIAEGSGDYRALVRWSAVVILANISLSSLLSMFHTAARCC